MRSSRRLWIVPACLLLLIGLPFFAGCGGDDDEQVVTPPTPPPATTGTIAGTASLPPGLPGDLGNARVGLFSSLDNWNADVPIRPFSRVIGTGSSVTIMESNLAPQNVIVEIWQDANRDGVFNAGDWWGISGTSTWPNPTISFVPVIAGQTSSVTIFLISIQQ